MKLTKEVKLGIVVTAALALFIFGFNFLKGRNIFSNPEIVYAVYTHIDGLVEANPVLVNGFKVGHVQDIEMLPDTSGKIIVTFVINDKNARIPKNSVAKIISSDLLGSKAVQIVFGNGASFVQSGDTMSAGTEDNLKDAVNKQIQPLKDKAENLISSIDSVIIVVQSVFNKGTTTNISKSVESIRQSLQNFEHTSQNLDLLVSSEKGKLSVIFSNIESISTNLANNNKKLTNMMNNFSSISDSLAKANLKSSIDNANIALSNAAEIMKKINQGKGSMGMLVNNDTLYNKLQASADQLDKLFEDIREHPKRYVHFSVFGGKDKSGKKK
ncbi:MAG TPA: MlaD family protein [Bacteroidia bacterium]|nr:MlaD family protein [Bacteroidia bacterium]